MHYLTNGRINVDINKYDVKLYILYKINFTIKT